MKAFRRELWFEIPSRRGFVNITPQVEEALRESGIREGLCLVNAMHITASVFINDDEQGLHQDYERWLEQLAPSSSTCTTEPGRTMAMRISNARSWGAKWSPPLPTAGSTSDRGSKFSTANSMVDDASAFC